MKEEILGNPNQLKKQFRVLSVRTKLIIFVILVSICTLITTAHICTETGIHILTTQVNNQLTSLRDANTDRLQNYIQFLVNHTETLSHDDMFINAMKEFKQAYDGLAKVNIPKAYEDKLQKYYVNEFLTQFTKLNPQEVRPLPEFLLPKTVASNYIQYHYIANNPSPYDEKYKLIDAKDGSQYSRVKAKYSRKFLDIANKFGYHDLYLIDTQGNVVYLLNNKPDLGTNLIQGPVAQSSLAKAYKDCIQSYSDTFVTIADFQPYLFSYNKPSAFVAAPIFFETQMIGVLAFQLPIARINEILNHSNHWKSEGLDETGEVYVVGEDSFMRSDSRFLLDSQKREEFFQVLRNNGISDVIIQKIRNFNTTIALLQIKNSDGIKQALNGNKTIVQEPDYRGVDVLGAYGPLEVPGVANLRWVIVAKKDSHEAFYPNTDFKSKVIGVAVLLTVIVTLVAVWSARIFVNPIERLIASARQVEAGDENAMVTAGTKDEFNDLARAFNKTIYNLRSQIRERERHSAESEGLLKKLLPLSIAKRLVAGEDPIADSVSNTTVMFTDLYRFSRLSQQMTGEQIVHLLDELVDAFDDLVHKYGLEKIKTIGDGYLAVCGLSVPRLDSDKQTIDCAIEMFGQVQRLNYKHSLNLELRVGINTGDVVAGTVGKSRFIYDVWGETVNIAHRLKSACPPGGILVSASIHDRLIDIYEFEPFRPIAEPDKDALEAWQLRSKSKAVKEDEKEQKSKGFQHLEVKREAAATKQDRRDSLNRKPYNS